MSAKVIIGFCALVLFVQSALSQCTSRAAVASDPGFYGPAALSTPYSLAADGLGLYGLGALDAPYGYLDSAYGAPCTFGAPWGLPALEFSPTTGGALPVASSSPIPPIGISVISDNIFEGPLAVAGELPFLGTVAMDGVLPSIGSGIIDHTCGNGVSAMVSEITAFTPGYAGAYSPGFAGTYASSLAAPALGYRAEWADRGCGCKIL